MKTNLLETHHRFLTDKLGDMTNKRSDNWSATNFLWLSGFFTHWGAIWARTGYPLRYVDKAKFEGFGTYNLVGVRMLLSEYQHGGWVEIRAWYSRKSGRLGYSWTRMNSAHAVHAVPPEHILFISIPPPASRLSGSIISSRRSECFSPWEAGQHQHQHTKHTHTQSKTQCASFINRDMFIDNSSFGINFLQSCVSCWKQAT